MSKNNGVKNHGVIVVVEEEATEITPAQIKYLQRLVDKKKPKKKSDLLLLISISIMIILTFVISMYANNFSDFKKIKTKIEWSKEATQFNEIKTKIEWSKEKRIRKAAEWIYFNLASRYVYEFRSLDNILKSGYANCYDSARLMYDIIEGVGFRPILISIYPIDGDGHAYVLYFDTASDNVMCYDNNELSNTHYKGSIDDYIEKYLRLPDKSRWVTCVYLTTYSTVLRTVTRE